MLKTPSEIELENYKAKTKNILDKIYKFNLTEEERKQIIEKINILIKIEKDNRI